MPEKFPKFIKLRNHRFQTEDISAISCHASSNYVGNYPIIQVYRKNIKEPLIIGYKKDGKPDMESYAKDRDYVDEVLIGKTTREENILP